MNFGLILFFSPAWGGTEAVLTRGNTTVDVNRNYMADLAAIFPGLFFIFLVFWFAGSCLASFRSVLSQPRMLAFIIYFYSINLRFFLFSLSTLFKLQQ